jgi:hypothetical protein
MEPTEENAVPHRPAPTIPSMGMGSGLSRSGPSTQPISLRPIKTEEGSGQMGFLPSLGQINQAAAPSIRPRNLSQPYADPSVYDRSRVLTPQERPAAPLLTWSSERFLTSKPSGPPVLAGGRSWVLDSSRTETEGLYPGRQAMQGTQVIGSNLDSRIEATPSRPRAMQTPALISIENTKSVPRLEGGLSSSGLGPTNLSKPRAMQTTVPPAAENTKPAARRESVWSSTGLRRADLQKWPCRRCHFVHKGSECETECIACGTDQHDRHLSTCPFKYKKRLEESSQQPTIKLEPEGSTEMRFPPVVNSRVSATMRLSLECQRRGFNPEFQYYSRKDVDNHHQADLYIKNIFISGGGKAYNSQKDARDALAPRGLEIVRQMGYGPSAGPLEQPKVVAGTSALPVSNQGSTAIRQLLPAPVLGSEAR